MHGLYRLNVEKLGKEVILRADFRDRDTQRLETSKQMGISLTKWDKPERVIYQLQKLIGLIEQVNGGGDG